MSGFSELLSEYARRGVYTKRQLADMCDIDRTLLQKIMSGERKPKNEEVVIKIASKLAISAEELKSLLEEYHILDVGSDIYYQRKEVENFIKDFYRGIKNPPRSESFSVTATDNQVDGISCKKGKFNIMNRMYNAFAKAIADSIDNPEIILYMQPQYDDVISALLNVCNKNTIIRQVVCLGNGNERNTIRNNMEIFHKLLPMSLSDSDYQVRFFYENVNSHRNAMQIFSNYIIVNKTVIMFDYEEENAVFIDNQDFYNIVSESFENIWKKSEMLIKRHGDIMEYIKGFFSEGKKYYTTLEYDPCVTFGFTREICDLLLIKDFPNRDVYIDSFMDSIVKIKNWVVDEKRPMKVFFTRSGLKNFMETGILGKYPMEMWDKPVPPDMRVDLMEAVLYAMKNGAYEAFVVNDDMFGMTPKELIEIRADGSMVMTRGVESGNMHFMEVQEQGIVSAFEDFFQNFETDSRVIAGELAYNYIYDEVEQYKLKMFFAGGVQPRKGTGRMAGRTALTTAGSRK